MQPTRTTDGLILMVIILLTTRVFAATPTLKPGDLLVVDNQYGVVLVDPQTGAQTLISRGGYLNTVSNSARGIAVEADGQILVTDTAIALANGSIVGGVVRVNPTTGVQTLLSSGGLLSQPLGVDVEANGDIVVTDRAGVIRIDPVSGTQDLVSGAGFVSGAQGLTVVRRSAK
jgi:hypothetical protein